MDDDVQANVYVGPKRVVYSGVVVPGLTLVLHAPIPTPPHSRLKLEHLYWLLLQYRCPMGVRSGRTHAARRWCSSLKRLIEALGLLI